MVPDGAHKFDSDWTAFFLWRPQVKGKFRDSTPFDGPEEVAKKKFPSINSYVYIYDNNAQNSGWVLQHKLLSQLYLCSPIQVKADGVLLHEIKPFEGLQYRYLNDTFVAVPASLNIVYGYQFLSKEDASRFTDFLDKIINNTTPEEAQLVPKTQQQSQKQEYVPEEFLYCLNVLINKKDETAKRGAIIKSLAICSRYSFVNIWRPLMLHSLEKYFKIQSLDVLKELFEIINGIDISPITKVSPNEKLIWRNSAHSKTIQLPVKLPGETAIEAPLCISSDEIGGDITIKSLYNKFGRQIIHIYNAILLEKKVLFVGYNIQSHEICKYVLSSLLMYLSTTFHAFPFI